jgi:hypothetical protein
MSDVSEHDSVEHESVEAVDSPDSPSTASTTTTTWSLPNWWRYAVLAIVIGVVALSVFAWFLPTDKFSAAQAADAKKQICQASTRVRHAITINSRRNPVHGDAGSALAVKTSARLALYGGGAYLEDRLAKQPATPADLAKAVGSLATTIQDLGIGYLAEDPDADQQSLRKDLGSELEQVNKLCQ